MNRYILIQSIGPVQGFIAAARRSRDLWCGSWLLSEIAKAAALHLLHNKAELIFPAETDEKKLTDKNFSVGNKIQACVTAADSNAVRQLAAAAAEAARRCFTTLATEARAKLGDAALRDNIWQAQINDYVEVQAAWAHIDDTADGYRTACERAASLLAARKTTRDFLPAALTADDSTRCLPKSSLDGARETVLLAPTLGQTARRKLGLADAEQLDCAGVTKRLCGDPEQFTPFTRIAADSWLRQLPASVLPELCKAYEPLVTCELATRVKGNSDCYHDFPYDAQYLYPARLAAVPKSRAEEAEALNKLRNVLRSLWRDYDAPCSYGVLLLADGDRMGELLDKATTIEQHQNITRALTKFAGSVPGIMREYRGHTIYAGGDDVLGFVPLNQAYACAQALAQHFADALQKPATQLQAERPPTLSVGLAIAHINTPLGHIRSLAARAERVAKGDQSAPDKQRNALGITLAVRSGSTSDIRLRWDDSDAHLAFQGWINAFCDKQLPSRIAYDARVIYQRTDFGITADPTLLRDIRNAELTRMLAQACTRDGIKLEQKQTDALRTRHDALADLNALANELITARWLTAKTQRDIGKEEQ